MIRIALLGAGLIGREHAELIQTHPGAELAAICDPSPEGKALAERLSVPHFSAYVEALEKTRPDGAIIALPNRLHEAAALACIDRGIASLVEKPVADTVAAGARIAEASEDRGVPVLVGHHRRHSPDIRAAKKSIAAGELGGLVAVNGMTLFDKPEPYFQAEWRRQPGGGPLLINLIHDIDALRHLVGEIESVRAFTSSAVRGFAVEDTASIAIRFRNGVLGSFVISDAAVSPWAWEYCSGQALYHPSQPGPCLFIAGRKAALSVSDMYLWRHAEQDHHWQHPLLREHRPGDGSRTYVNQLDHFLAVIRREAAPLISARDGLATLAATLAVEMAAREDRTVTLDEMLATAGQRAVA
ncbi:Gfo/Idh/MocA family oxidoreductase [Paracoccus sp. CPCC 101403]|uniref:Gfo/Idh/MocA family oxidoreductase n=1 Tax=Paracoccus broussonetiae TaxID=3075834 RepID=A0ABU3E9K7_9RHOB|nr:Gfo/Idh/MocA family oxidoreductase [Paracoccus sp. CPCC 101403]MDT1060912.1 Gfo/Idh/MocA family oxidoreductase [Paracoccus sp. CPCC 101403]